MERPLVPETANCDICPDNGRTKRGEDMGIRGWAVQDVKLVGSRELGKMKKREEKRITREKTGNQETVEPFYGR